MRVKLLQGRDAGKTVEMAYQFAKPLIESGRAELEDGHCPNIAAPAKGPEQSDAIEALVPAAPVGLVPDVPSKGKRPRR